MNKFILIIILLSAFNAIAANDKNKERASCEYDKVVQQLTDGEIKKPVGWYGLLELGCSERQAKEIWAKIILKGGLK